MRTAYFDLIGGAAGDMLLAALLDAGAGAGEVETHLRRLGVPFELRVSRARRGFLDACHVDVVARDEEDHRHLDEVLELIEKAALPARAADRAATVFRALAAAEGKVHGVSPDEVHFHEVGAVDAIVDVVGSCLALELLGVDRVEASPLPLGSGGAVRAEHGLLPLPPPAVLRLAEAARAPIAGRAVAAELVTPTGAAVLTALATRFGPYPALLVERVGYGAGSRDAPEGELPNVVGVVLGRAPEPAAPGDVVVLEASLDNQPPEHTAYLCEALLAAGALDVHATPVHMKKGRPGVVVTVLAEPARAGALEGLLFAESPTLGVRRRHEARSVLPREVVTVDTPHGRVRVKVAVRPDGRRTFAPEHEDCARLARERGVPLAEVHAAAARAASAPP